MNVTNPDRNQLVHLAMSGYLSPQKLRQIADERMDHTTIPKQVHDFISSNPFDNLKETYQKHNCQWITYYDDCYPERLREIYQPPMVLFYQGDITLLNNICLGIVGSREDSGYGKRVLQHFIPSLVKEGIVTVSGLAAGVDTAVHRFTLAHNGKTIGVIATGIDQVFPAENQSLQMELATNHLLLTEYPLHMRARRYHFPMRNRIIAGISHGLMVVEAKQRSGSLITANVALQENREVFAVPGNIFEAGCRGTNELIQAGAKAILTVDDILLELPQK